MIATIRMQAGLIGTLFLLTGGLSMGCTTTAPGPPASAEPVVPASPYAHLESVQAFAAVRASLDDMAAVILEDAQTEREASEGMRVLLRALAMSTDVSGDANPKAPHFARMDTKIRKVGGDNPDAEYDHVVLDKNWDYIIRGNVGTVRHLSFTIMGARGASGRPGMIGYFNERTLEPEVDGEFEIHLTKSDMGGQNWVDTSEGISSILIRQYIGDREEEVLATYEVEVVGREPYVGIPYSTDREIAAAIRGANFGFRTLVTLHRTVMPELFENPNQFVRANSDDFGADISGSDNLYMLGSYQVDENEALIIETEPLDVRYWNLAVESRWHETVDYLTRRTHRSLDHVQLDPDGKLRFVLAHGKTPHPNWLDTGGHREGFLTFRWVGERDSQVALPKITRVPRDQVEAELARQMGSK